MDVILDDNNFSTAPPISKSLITQGNFELNFLTVLGYESSSPPLGALLKQYYQLEGEWLVASPIFWQASHNDAFVVAANNGLELSDEESHAWFKEVEQFLLEENFSMHYHNAYTWLINATNKPQLNSQPVHLIMHKSLMPFLEEMDSTLYWQRIFTELQMFLTNHTYNLQRMNKPIINGLWFYGGGQFALNSKKLIMTNDVQYRSAFSQYIKQLELNEPIDNKSILLLKNISHKDIEQVAELLKNRTVNWFWNNTAYQITKKYWWNKLWRGLMNAN
ncbi:cofactor-independent phosphoglycerate mutase [Legionella busanensis]|uniref:Cofactor-independent phosphoglycerate mutase n=1 Tax=Legionella busanensis TaxID=190655 RepID=A0A378JMI1_9GAMM|nr:hypothetical protein [Legionella busanensis]STX51513.1 cofactor-independent phosphoglycerate mutase [Legionella busanensis]